MLQKMKVKFSSVPRFTAAKRQWRHSFTRFFTALREVLWDALDMFGVLSACGTAGGARMRASSEKCFLPGLTPP